MRVRLTSAVLIVLVAFVTNAGAGTPLAARDTLRFGTPRVASVSTSDVVVEVPVRLSPVGIDGTIEHVVFTDMRLNGIPFEVENYDTAFELPSDDPVDLPRPLRLRAVFATVTPGLFSEAIMPSDTLHLTGRVIVVGTFRKWIFSIHRTAETKIDEMGPNPIAEYHPLRAALEKLAELERYGVKLPF